MMDDVGEVIKGLEPQWFSRLLTPVVQGFSNDVPLGTSLCVLRAPLALLIALSTIILSRPEWVHA